MYDVDVYRLLTELDDTILQRNRDLENLKENLAEASKFVELDESYAKDVERLTNEIAELYLSINYAQTIRATIQGNNWLEVARIASHFITQRFDNETFNLIYESTLEEIE